jgi:heme a synthase
MGGFDSKREQTLASVLRHGLLLACIACLMLIAFGGFVRLTHAGLGCPDWPTCYGKLTWPKHADEVALANQLHPETPVQHSKTWPEQVHRIIAAALGLWVLLLTLISVRLGGSSAKSVYAGVLLIALSIPIYMRGNAMAASLFALAGECFLLAKLLRVDNRSRWLLAALAWICVQALFGMWTVTWKLKPFIVTAHLLGGMALIALLFWTWVRAEFKPALLPSQRRISDFLLVGALLVLLTQITLGGWVSTNYASWACPDFPRCQGEWLTETDFREGFVLWRGIGVNYEGGILDGPARVAIHLSHRVGAIVAALVLFTLALLAFLRGYKWPAVLLSFALIVQIALGVANIKLALPLAVAVAHNAMAAVLLLCLLWLIRCVRYPPSAQAGSTNS